MESVAPYLSSCAPSIELIDDRYPAKRNVRVMVADGFLSHGLVLGKETPVDQILKHVGSLKTDLRIDGKVVAEGNSKNVSGNPLVHLVAIAKVFGEMGLELQAGQVVSTGSTIVPWWPNKDFAGKGFRVRGTVEKLGMVDCEIVVGPCDAAKL
jgi:2-keto-4-pentenoate hydratase